MSLTFHWLFVLCIGYVQSAEDGSAVLEPPTPPKRSFRSLDVVATSLIAEACDVPDLSSFSRVGRVPHEASQFWLGERKELWQLEKRLSTIVALSPFFFPEFDARDEIKHYLNGFDGRIALLVDYLETTMGHDIHGLCVGMRRIRARLDEIRNRDPARSSLALHLQPTARVLTPEQKLLFDAYIALRDESKEMILNLKEGERTMMETMDCATWSLVVEHIGVMIGYPTLETKWWTQMYASTGANATSFMLGSDDLEGLGYFVRMRQSERGRHFVQHLRDFVEMSRAFVRERTSSQEAKKEEDKM